MRALRENWPWVVVPILVVAVLLVVVYFLGGDPAPVEEDPFDYPIF